MIPSAEVDPFHARKVRSEFRLDGLQRYFKRVGVLLAKGVKNAALRYRRADPPGNFPPLPQTRKRRAGIVDAVFPASNTPGLHGYRSFFPKKAPFYGISPTDKVLKKRYGRRAQNFPEVLLPVRGREDVVFPAEMLRAQPAQLVKPRSMRFRLNTDLSAGKK
jgi:hypothetical protein